MFVLESLAWDSAHFGFPVARLVPPDLGDAALAEALRTARRDRFRLVYWATRGDREVPSSLLRAGSGMLADRRALFVSGLAAKASPDPSLPIVVEYPRGPASPRLLELAVVAGSFSRFRADPRIPIGSFEELYKIWMRRSTSGELADGVLVAMPEERGGEPLGVVTVSATGDLGTIGLIAVRDEARGHGVGSRLLEAAHRWMGTRGVIRASVTTQLGNRPACRLYERSGYALDKIENYYHFWPAEDQGRA